MEGNIFIRLNKEEKEIIKESLKNYAVPVTKLAYINKDDKIRRENARKLWIINDLIERIEKNDEYNSNNIHDNNSNNNDNFIQQNTNIPSKKI